MREVDLIAEPLSRLALHCGNGFSQPQSIALETFKLFPHFGSGSQSFVRTCFEQAKVSIDGTRHLMAND